MLGNLLKEARCKANLEISDISRALFIKQQYLIAIEEDGAKGILRSVYAKGYTKKYADFLGVDLNMHSFVDAQAIPSKRKSDASDTWGFSPKIFALIALAFGVLAISSWNLMHGEHKPTLIELLYNVNNR
ncbi:MAG: helix-turn-helix domain-containing protein [Pseudomonadota bacterium]